MLNFMSQFQVKLFLFKCYLKINEYFLINFASVDFGKITKYNCWHALWKVAICTSKTGCSINEIYVTFENILNLSWCDEINVQWQIDGVNEYFYLALSGTKNKARRPSSMGNEIARP